MQLEKMGPLAAYGYFCGPTISRFYFEIKQGYLYFVFWMFLYNAKPQRFKVAKVLILIILAVLASSRPCPSPFWGCVKGFSELLSIASPKRQTDIGLQVFFDLLAHVLFVCK